MRPTFAATIAVLSTLNAVNALPQASTTCVQQPGGLAIVPFFGGSITVPT